MSIQNRKSRFHDEKGNRVDAGGLIYAVPAFVTAVLRVAFDYRPERPTISYRAQRRLNELIQSDWRCAEFGSGMSTPWLARRCAFLLSVENDQTWHRKVERMIAAAGLGNVSYEFRQPDQFADLAAYPDGHFDFVLIDGWDRHGCVVSALAKLKPGGWIYLDNSDKDMTIPGGDLRRAEEALLEAVRARDGSIEYFVDFSPTNFFAEQGLLARL